jgi:hypothetical protein
VAYLPATANSPGSLLLHLVSHSTSIHLGAPVLQEDQPVVLRVTCLPPLVSDQSDDHGVEVEEEHKQVETKLDERLLLVHVKLPEDLRGIKQVLVLEDPVRRTTVSTYFFVFCETARRLLREAESSELGSYVLLRVPCKEGQVENERHPVAVDQEQDSQESVDTGLRDDVHVEAVAQVDRVDVVAFQVRVHDGEEDLQEEVDGIDQDREEEQPG